MRGRQGTKIRTRRRLAGLPAWLRPVWPHAKRAYATAIYAVAPASQWLSRVRGGHGPRRIAPSADEVRRRGEGYVWTVREQETLSHPVPLGLPERHPTLCAQTVEVVPRVALAALPGGRSLGPYRAILTAAGTFVDELSPYFGTTRPEHHPVFLSPLPPAPTHVPGRVGVLAARGDVTYYHFLIDVLPRLAILEACSSEVAPDYLYVPTSLPFQRELLALLGIGGERIIDSDTVPHLEADMLVVPGLPDTHLRTPPWTIAFLRERLLADAAPSQPTRRIYITRGRQRGSRIVENEPELIALLVARGFTVVDPGALSVADQITLFAEAECIVAPHGGALTNLAFAGPGASVIELFAPDYVQGCYWKLSDCVPGLTYRYLVGTGRPARADRMWGVDSDMRIDLQALERLLEGLPASATMAMS